MLVEHHFEALRRWHIQRRVVAAFGEPALAGCDQRPGKKVPIGEGLEKVRRYRLAPQPFGIESGELTPTLKVKRKFVAQKYADLLASMARG